MAALTGYGLHELVWETADEWVGEVFVASPADASGRGIALSVKRNGSAVDLTGASVYLLWRHREALTRGTELFEEVDASAGTFQIYYPAPMAGYEGTVDAQVMVSEDGTCISTRTFQVRVEQVLVGDTDIDDGFTLFVEAIQAYENASVICTDAAMAANAAAASAGQAESDLRAAALRGDFDGADGIDGVDGTDGVNGEDGADGISPTVTVETISRGHRMTVTDVSGPHSFDVLDGRDGADGEDGASPEAYVEQTSTGARIVVTDGSGTTTATLNHGAKGDTGSRGPQGAQGPAGADGDDYVLTNQDKSDIAALVAAMFTAGDSQSY